MPIATILMVVVLVVWVQSCVNAEKEKCRENGGTPIVDYQRNVVCIQEGLR